MQGAFIKDPLGEYFGVTEESVLQVSDIETAPQLPHMVSTMLENVECREGVGEITTPQFDTTTTQRRMEALFAQSRVQKLTSDLANKLQSLIVAHKNVASQLIRETATSDLALFKHSRRGELIWGLAPLEQVCSLVEEYMKQLLIPILNSDWTDMEASPTYENSEMSSQLFMATVDLHTKAKATYKKSQKKQVQSLGCDGPLNEVKTEKLNDNSKTERKWRKFKAQYNKTFSFKVKPTLLLIVY